MNANNPVCRVWRGGRGGRGGEGSSGVDKDMNFTVETAPYRVTVLSKMLNKTTFSWATLLRTSEQICRDYGSGPIVYKFIHAVYMIY